ncbi:MAG: DUF4878 domain-containing protein [Bacteroidales bacterium]|nr:DUF4878 domain-containing protein [Bacteroidales bacterium]
MKKIIFSATVIFALLFCVSCKKNDPEGVAKSFLSSLQKENYYKAADCCYYDCKPEELEGRHNAVQLYCEIYGRNIQKNGGIKSFTIDKVEENGDNAVVTATISFGNGKTITQKTKTKKIDGKWYLQM